LLDGDYPPLNLDTAEIELLDEESDSGESQFQSAQGHILYSRRVEKLKSEEGGVKSEQSFKISSHKTLVS